MAAHGRTRSLFAFAWCLGTFLRLAVSASAVEWPRFRGPNGAGVSDSKGLPVPLSATKHVVWKTPLPSFGSSSPVVWGKRVFLTGNSGYGIDRK